MDKKRIEKSREGVPIWDGDAGTFQEFEENSLVWEQSVAHHKRYLCGPKIVAELQGTARRFVLGKRPDWVTYNGGVQRLMDHLRQSLGLPQLPELTDHLTKFFKQGRRRKGETMNDYITRKTETYVRACQSLARVMQTYGGTSSGHSSSASRTMGPWENYAPSYTGAPSSDHATEETFHEAAEEDDENEDVEDPWASARSDRHSTSWWWSSAWDNDWRQDSWSGYWDSSKSDTPTIELLPDMIQGWYLLCDAGLDTGERNMILASLKQDFSFNRVAQELRNQWTDDDLKRRDQSGRHSSWWANDLEDDDDPEPQDIFVSTEDLNEEGKAIMMAAQEEAEHALAAVQQGKRTLREARDRQHQVRMSRKYFKTSFKPYKGEGKGKSQSSSSTCLRCGGDHRTSNCPKPSSSSSALNAEQSAPFICYAEENPLDMQQGNVVVEGKGNSAFSTSALPTTSEVVSQGKAVLDGGATKTLGSVRALERIMELNQEVRGENGLASLDLSERPTFGFGNGAVNQCVSTAALKIQADGKDGRLSVHALDSGEGPVLFSIASLRALGAVVDFEEDLIVFRRLNDKKVIQLERSNTGHQLLPMTKDWYESSFETAKPVPSLRHLI